MQSFFEFECNPSHNKFVHFLSTHSDEILNCMQRCPNAAALFIPQSVSIENVPLSTHFLKLHLFVLNPADRSQFITLGGIHGVFSADRQLIHIVAIPEQPNFQYMPMDMTSRLFHDEQPLFKLPTDSQRDPIIVLRDDHIRLRGSQISVVLLSEPLCRPNVSQSKDFKADPMESFEKKQTKRRIEWAEGRRGEADEYLESSSSSPSELIPNFPSGQSVDPLISFDGLNIPYPMPPSSSSTPSSSSSSSSLYYTPQLLMSPSPAVSSNLPPVVTPSTSSKSGNMEPRSGASRAVSQSLPGVFVFEQLNSLSSSYANNPQVTSSAPRGVKGEREGERESQQQQGKHRRSRSIELDVEGKGEGGERGAGREKRDGQEERGEKSTSAVKRPIQTRSASVVSTSVNAPQSGPQPSRFIQLINRPEAKEIANSIRRFIQKFTASPPDPKKYSDVLRTFSDSIEQQIASHPLWKNEKDDEEGGIRDGVEKLLTSKLFSLLFVSTEDDKKKDLQLERKMKMLNQFLDPAHLDIRPHLIKPDQISRAIAELGKINFFKSPRDKMICIMNCCKVIYGMMNAVTSSNDEEAAGADDFLPILIFVGIRANIPSISLNVRYIRQYRHPSRLSTEIGYYFTQFESVLHFVAEADHTRFTIEKSLWDHFMESDEGKEKMIEREGGSGIAGKGKSSERERESSSSLLSKIRNPLLSLTSKNGPPQTSSTSPNPPFSSTSPIPKDFTLTSVSRTQSESDRSYLMSFSDARDLRIGDVETLLREFKMMYEENVQMRKELEDFRRHSLSSSSLPLSSSTASPPSSQMTQAEKDFLVLSPSSSLRPRNRSSSPH